MPKPIRKFNMLVSHGSYQGHDGREKQSWRNIGEIAEWQNEDGTTTFSASLHFMPKVKIAVFEQKPRDEKASANGYAEASGAPNPPPPNDGDSIRTEDISF